MDVDERENETENLLSSGPGASQRKEPSLFTAEVCEKLRVPCRFVTEHPCCALPQGIDMMGRLVVISSAIIIIIYQGGKEGVFNLDVFQTPSHGRQRGPEMEILREQGRW